MLQAILFLCLTVFTSIQAAEVVEDDTQITTTRSWNEFEADLQRQLVCYFENMLTTNLEQLGIPSFWNDEAKSGLLGDQDKYNGVVGATHSQAQTYATNQKIALDDLLPVGFFVGLGVSGSDTVIAGMGGTALLTLVIVPVEVSVYDKTTGTTTTTYEASWALGGLGQGAVETGASTGIAVRGAFGLIWGHLPDATFLQGMAVGVGGGLSAVVGLSFKAAILFNSSKGANDGTDQTTNVIAMASYDMGIEASATVEAVVFYFLSQDQIMKFLSTSSISTFSGTSTIAAGDL